MLPSPPLPPSFSLTTHTSVASIYNATHSFLQSSEIHTHIVLSHILKLHNSPSRGSPPPPLPESLWIACWSESRALELLVAVTNGQLGPHPIFIVAPTCPNIISPTGLRQRMSRITGKLLELVPVERVHSVFGPKCLAQAFADAWSQRVPTAVPEEQPYTSVIHKQCTSRTLQPTTSLPSGHRMRLVSSDDEEQIATICREYSKTTHVTLNMEDARQEALSLISERAVYVYEVASTNGSSQLVSMVAAGRKSEGVACITKIYRAPGHEKRGYATRLVHHVCSQLLTSGRKTTVTAFLPHDNRAADNVLRNLGFLDIERGPSDWLEVGFQDTQAGHW